ncbi:MAG: hypothetical protein ACJ71M_11160 [Nitrososphaeraceae archaeon]
MIYEEMKSGDIVDKSKKDIEQLIYDFICSLEVAVVDSERSKGYFREILSRQKIYESSTRNI